MLQYSFLIKNIVLLIKNINKESMQNQEIVKMIDNLKGRKGYEEKRASKLGFSSLYAYFEDKISKKQKAIEDEQKELEATKIESQSKPNKKSCGCC